MATLDAIYAELKMALVAATGLPDPPPGAINFYTSVQAARKNIIEQIKNGRITLPTLIFDGGSFVPDTEFGIGDVQTKRFPFAAYWIAQWGGADGSQDAVCEEGIAMALAIDEPAVPFSAFFVIEPAQIDSGIDAELNAALADQKLVQVTTSSVRWMPGFQIQLPIAS